MPDGTADSVLELKAQAQRRALGVGAVSIPRALGRSLSIAADALWALGLTCTTARDDTLPTERAFQQLSDDQLLIILEKDSAPCALMALDRSVVTSLIEVQTLGKVTRFPLDDRDFTPTDAAMMAPMVDATLPRFGSMLAGQPERAHLQGYGFGAHVEDARAASLAIEGDQLQIVCFDIGIAQDTREGRVVFLFPEPTKTSEADSAGTQHGKHEDAMKMVPARMRGILTRIHVPLSKAQALRPGDTLEISSNALTAATLVVDGGHVVAKGKMGQMNGFRAIRIGGEPPLLHKPVAPDPGVQVPTVPSTAVPDASGIHAPPMDAASGSMDPSPLPEMTLNDLPAGMVDPADLL